MKLRDQMWKEWDKIWTIIFTVPEVEVVVVAQIWNRTWMLVCEHVRDEVRTNVET